MSITADSIQFFVQNRQIRQYILESNKIAFGWGASNPAGEADGAPSDPLVDWDQERYTHVPRRGPLPFSFLSTPSVFWSLADLRPRIRGSLVGFGVRKCPSGPRDEAPAGV